MSASSAVMASVCLRASALSGALFGLLGALFGLLGALVAHLPHLSDAVVDNADLAEADEKRDDDVGDGGEQGRFAEGKGGGFEFGHGQDPTGQVASRDRHGKPPGRLSTPPGERARGDARLPVTGIVGNPGTQFMQAATV